MGGAGPQLQHWGAEQSEACGISCSAHQSPHRAPEPLIPAAMAPATGVNVVVVVDGSCILQYTHRDSPCRCSCRRDTPRACRLPASPSPPLTRRPRGLGVRCCAELCLGEEEERAEQRPRPLGAPRPAPPPGRLTPVPLPRSATGPWFTVEAPEEGGPGAQVARIWDRGRCPLLEEGDLVAKVNGADVRGLGPREVENVLQQHTRAGDVILLVERRGPGLRQPPSEPLFSFPAPCQDPARAEGQGGPRGSWGRPSRDTLAITSFVGPEPRDVLLCPARCRGEETPRARHPQPVGDLGELGGSVAPGRAADRLVPGPSGDPSGGKRQEDRGLLARFSHPELGGLFRQAGAKVRLRMLSPTRDTAASSDLDAGAELEVDEGDGRLGCQLPQPQGLMPPQDPPSYSVELRRGPLGFGFSLRGGSEYNMDIYVLGLLEGGPAQQSGKIQASDQLVEINGEPTRGMTHARAVARIRHGGSRIHLVLRKGNGFVPDYATPSCSLALCVTNSRRGEPCFCLVGRLERDWWVAPPLGQSNGPTQLPLSHSNREHIPSPTGQDQMPEGGPAPCGRRADPAEGSPRWRQDNAGCLEASPVSAKRGSHHCHQRGSLEHRGTEQGWPAPGKEVEAGRGETGSLSPQRERIWRGLSDPAPGPWLVPSKERLSRALRGVCMAEGEDDERGSLGQGIGGEVKRRT